MSRKKPRPPLRSRSVREEWLHIDAHPCHCGERGGRPPVVLELRDGEMLSVYAWSCPRCRRERRFELVVPERQPQASASGLVPLGGADLPSLLDPGQLLLCGERCLEAGDLDGAVAAIDEVLRLADLAPPYELTEASFTSPEGRELFARRPRRQLKNNLLMARRQALRALRLSRMPAPAPLVRLEPDPVFSRYEWERHLGSSALRAHREWQERGRSGPGRIDLEGKELSCARLSGVRLGGARLRRCRWLSADVSMGNALGALDLAGCDVNGSSFAGSTMGGSRLVGCNFEAVDFCIAFLARSYLEGCSFTVANFDRANLADVEARDCSFFRARLSDLRLYDAVFIRCEFREAAMERRAPELDLAVWHGAWFEDCDFRGANLDGVRLARTTFVRCRFHGVTGRPEVDEIQGIQIVEPDLSPEGDGSQIADAEAVRALLGIAGERLFEGTWPTPEQALTPMPASPSRNELRRREKKKLKPPGPRRLEAQPDEEVELRSGDRVRLAGSDLELELISYQTWEGSELSSDTRATVELRVKRGAEAQELSLEQSIDAWVIDRDGDLRANDAWRTEEAIALRARIRWRPQRDGTVALWLAATAPTPA